MIRQGNLTKEAVDDARKANKESGDSASKAIAESERSNRETAELTKRSLALTEQSNERAQRAWILFQTYTAMPAQNTMVMRLAPQMYLRLIFRNYGKTPARDLTLTHWIGVSATRPTRIPKLQPTHAFPGRSILGPDAQLFDNVKL